MTTIYGVRNTAIRNLHPEGDVTWFATRAERDQDLAASRDAAIAEGLSEGAARWGMRPIRRRTSARVAAELVNE